ncbi:hypothetical protein LCGC14_1998750 [marine sediment metagenome]|uniref:Uncharacterized protein n=1 Tax=marine sediment metagenome TaxID=412755 RepID=A0A0F9I0Y6_9ZZZZ
MSYKVIIHGLSLEFAEGEFKGSHIEQAEIMIANVNKVFKLDSKLKGNLTFTDLENQRGDVSITKGVMIEIVKE